MVYSEELRFPVDPPPLFERWKKDSSSFLSQLNSTLGSSWTETIDPSTRDNNWTIYQSHSNEVRSYIDPQATYANPNKVTQFSNRIFLAKRNLKKIYNRINNHAAVRFTKDFWIMIWNVFLTPIWKYYKNFVEKYIEKRDKTQFTSKVFDPHKPHDKKNE